jgi:selenophosphate synthetase-related protein
LTARADSIVEAGDDVPAIDYHKRVIVATSDGLPPSAYAKKAVILAGDDVPAIDYHKRVIVATSDGLPPSAYAKKAVTLAE